MTNVMSWGMALGGAVLSLMFGVMGPAVTIDAGDDVESHDLSRLQDGETLVLGEGEGRITVTREGDEVLVELPGEPGEEPRKLRWKTDGGPHFAYRIDTDGGHAVVFDRESVAADEKQVEVLAVRTSDEGLGERLTVLLDRLGLSAGQAETSEDDGETTIVVKRAKGQPLKWVTAGEGEGVAGVVVELEDDRKVLRCPEGDTTMRVDRDEPRTFYCPQHNVVLEEVEPERRMIKTIRRYLPPEDAD